MRLARALALGALCALACGKTAGSGAPPGASAKPGVSVSSAPGSASAPSAPVEPSPPPATCRALRVTSAAKVGEAPLVSGAELDGADWVSLDAGAGLTLKHTSSGREIAISGPALFRACRRGREQILLVRGTLQGGAGMGVRPGAEVLVATPIAGLRYGDADFKLTLDEKKLAVEVRAGQLDVDSASDKPLKTPLRAKDKLTVPLGKPNPSELMARCQAAAERAVATAREVGDKSSPEPLGERARAHVKARRAARSACTIAAASIGLVADPQTSAGLWAEAARGEGLWETIPRPPRAKPPEK